MNELPKNYQSIVKSASELAYTLEQAKYDAGNPAALKRLVANRRALASIPTGGNGGELQGRHRYL